MPGSNITKDEGHANQLHNWLKEDGSDGEFGLVYRSSRDSLSGVCFYSKCDNQGRTLTIIETTSVFSLVAIPICPRQALILIFGAVVGA